LLEKFIYSFFDQNPISQLGIIVSYNKKAEKLCDLVGNPRKIIDKLKSLNEKLCNGEISIQNSLELAIKTLKLEYFSLKKLFF
jgi:transcription initiation factor TFIIH subunit 2